MKKPNLFKQQNQQIKQLFKYKNTTCLNNLLCSLNLFNIHTPLYNKGCVNRFIIK